MCSASRFCLSVYFSLLPRGMLSSVLYQIHEYIGPLNGSSVTHLPRARQLGDTRTPGGKREDSRLAEPHRARNTRGLTHVQPAECLAQGQTVQSAQLRHRRPLGSETAAGAVPWHWGNFAIVQTPHASICRSSTARPASPWRPRFRLRSLRATHQPYSF